jgi:hypothetical protein
MPADKLSQLRTQIAQNTQIMIHTTFPDEKKLFEYLAGQGIVLNTPGIIFNKIPNIPSQSPDIALKTIDPRNYN